jgi:hypothetical protein
MIAGRLFDSLGEFAQIIAGEYLYLTTLGA